MKRFFLLVSLQLFISVQAFAGGVTAYEIATPEIRLATAGWAARADDPSTVFTNPAGMTRISCPEVQLGIQPYYPSIKFDANSQTTVFGSSGNSSFWLPSGSSFVVIPCGEDLRFGVGSLGYFGAALNYGKKWVGRYYLTKTLMEGFSLIPTVAYRLTDNLSIGVGVNVMYAIFNQHSAINNVLDGLPDGVLKVRDNTFGYGANVGILYELDCNTRFGVQYLSEVKLRFKDKPIFLDVGPKLQALIASTGITINNVVVHANVPNTVMLSFYHQLDCPFVIMGNLGWQQWSRFGRVSISLNAPDAVSLTVVEKFQDTWHAAFCLEYLYDPCLKVSAGVAYDSSAVTKKERTFDFPVGSQWRIGTGFEYALKENMFLNMGYEIMWSGNLPVFQQRGSLGGIVAGRFKNLCIHFLDCSLNIVF